MALNASEFFDLQIDEARHMARTMATLIRQQWRQALRDKGCSVEEVRGYVDAFDHEKSSIAAD